jgi:hypothetical protein
MNHDGTRLMTLNHNPINKVTNMNNRFVSLISILSFFAGPIACSDAGDAQSDTRGRDSQALSASAGSREVNTEGEAANGTDSLTIGANPTSTPTTGTGGLTIGAPVTGAVTLEPGRSSGVVVDESGGSTTLIPGEDDVREIDSNTDVEPRVITWGDADAGVEIRLGVDAEEACAQLRSACLSSGETVATCDGLVEECEEAVANPSAPTDSIGFVTDCDEMGASCKAAGGSADECAAAVALCKSGDAGVSTSEATIVQSCEELRASCAQAGLTDAQCDEVVAACESPSTTSGSEVGLGLDCAAVLASCLSYGIAEAECKEVQKECETTDTAAGGNDIRLK